MPHDEDRLVHLRRGGTSLLVRLPRRDLPSLAHWGQELPDTGPGAGPGAGSRAADERALLAALAVPDTDSLVTTQEVVPVLPRTARGWLGHPGVVGGRDGAAWSLDYTAVDHEVHEAGSHDWPDGPVDAVRVVSTAQDTVARVVVGTELELLASGLVRLRAWLENRGDDPYQVDQVRVSLPVPATATELVDLTGRHTHERHPQRHPFPVGAWVRDSRGGRPGLDAPTLLLAGSTGFGFRGGRVWGVHVAHNGSQQVAAERTVVGWRLLGGGELLAPGEVRLAPGERYTTPWLVGSWGDGLDALAARLHRYLRARPAHPTTPRPVLLNTWEAVYFDHDLDTLLDLADRAARVGVERFVLDDGWFLGRRHDRAGLGDWVVDPDVWPEGLHPLVSRVRDLGMQFGLWVEPEMVNLDSHLARDHPDWLLATEHGPGIPSRQQHVLDLGNLHAFAHVFERISALVEEYDVAYLKWDHNRPVLDPAHQPHARPAGRDQAAAVLRLMTALRRRHPGLEIESCAGGGGRVDLRTVEATDRVWVSDCIDPHERHRMVRWTGLLLPPELLGTHIGSATDHTTDRHHSLAFRAATALWGHLGIENDLTTMSDADLSELAEWVQLHKQHRHLLHSGDVVHADRPDPAVSVDGVVAADGSAALYRISLLEHPLTWPIDRITFPGLRDDTTYRLALEHPATSAPDKERMPRWATDGVRLPGSVLTTVGVSAPALRVAESVLVSVHAA